MNEFSDKCPYCGKLILSLRISEIEATVPMEVRWDAVTFNCPFCNKILGCQKDTTAAEADILDEIIKKIKSEH